MLGKPDSAYHSDCGFALTWPEDFPAAANYFTASRGNRLFRKRVRAALGTIGALLRCDCLTGGRHDTRIHPHSRSH